MSVRLQLEYYKHKQIDHFVRILEVSGSEASLDYSDVEHDQMSALDILAAHYVNEVTFLYCTKSCTGCVSFLLHFLTI